MEKLMSDNAQSEISTRLKDILRAFFVDEWKSEAYYQHQYFAEWRFQTINQQLLDATGVPEFAWLLSMCYIFFIKTYL